jgi:hypothetical protein
MKNKNLKNREKGCRELQFFSLVNLETCFKKYFAADSEKLEKVKYISYFYHLFLKITGTIK